MNAGFREGINQKLEGKRINRAGRAEPTAVTQENKDCLFLICVVSGGGCRVLGIVLLLGVFLADVIIADGRNALKVNGMYKKIPSEIKMITATLGKAPRRLGAIRIASAHCRLLS